MRRQTISSRLLSITSALVFSTLLSVAQTPQSTLTTGTQLVVVDVVVQDHDGHPIHGLKQADFSLEEGKTPQSVRTFDEHSAVDSARAKLPPVPPMPPGTFTNYTPVSDSGALTILLLDTLNTPTRDQGYVRSQLRKYIQAAAPGARVAIFGLNGNLILLQGFTADPALLKAAVDRKLIHQSAALADPSGAGEHPNLASETLAGLQDTLAGIGVSGTGFDALGSAVGDMQRFEGVSASFQTNVRTRLTLEAFAQLAHYLGAFPGRKNLIWFSESFPISLLPNPDLKQAFDVVKDSSEEFRATTGLLARSRVAVYPVDAREVLNAPVFGHVNTAIRLAKPALDDFQSDINKFDVEQAQEHATLAQMAEDTGGQAYYDGTPLSTVVARTIDSGSSYYTLTYSPSNRNWKGEYRRITVQLQGAAAARGIKLAYRRGYYADDPNNRRASSSILTAAAAAAPPTGSAAYTRAAMQRGAPTPSEVPFIVRVLPASTAVDDKPDAHNGPNPNGSFKGPFRLFNVDIAVLVSNFDLQQDAGLLRHGSVEYVTYVYDTNGRLLNTDSSTVSLSLTPENYKKLTTEGLGFHQKVSVPAKGESFLRIAVHDIPSGRFGAVEVPSAAVIRLPPAAPTK